MAMDYSQFTTPRSKIELMIADKLDKLPATTTGEIREFTAVALTDAVPLSREQMLRYAADPKATSGGEVISRFVLKAKIIGDVNGDPLSPEQNPHHFLLDPCKMGTTDDPNLVLRITKLYTTYVSSKDFNVSDGDSVTIKRNDRILVTMTVDSRGHLILERGEVTELIERAQDNRALLNNCDAMAGLFDTTTVTILGGGHDYSEAFNAKASSRAVDFYNLLKNYFPAEEYCDSFLMGLTANAQVESSFNARANGDPRETVGGNSNQAIEVDGRYYCSFGYWQFNVCSGGGERYAQAHGITDIVNNKEELYKLITDSDTQMKYMSKYMKEKFGADVQDCSKTPEYWGQRIAVEFERCSHCKAYGSGGNATSTVKRGAIAEDLADKV